MNKTCDFKETDVKLKTKMKRVVFLIILLLTNCPLIFCSTTKFEQRTELEIEIKYSKYFDLVFHVLAYLEVHNASSLYDTKYIEKMAIEKQNFEFDIIPKINLLQEYYNNNFGRLMMINFLPFYTTDFNDIKNIFINFNQFTQRILNISSIRLLKLWKMNRHFSSITGTNCIMKTKFYDI